MNLNISRLQGICGGGILCLLLNPKVLGASWHLLNFPNTRIKKNFEILKTDKSNK